MNRLTFLFFICFIILFPYTSLAVDDIKAIHKVLHSASELDYPPLALVNHEGKADGLSVELLRASVQAMGHDITFKVGPWEEIKQELAQRKLDVLPLVGRTPEREQFFDFTFPYYSLHGTVIVRKKDVRIKSTSDLKGKTIAVMKGDNAEEYLHRETAIANSSTIITTNSFKTALKELSQGKHDAVVIDHVIGLRLIKQLGLDNLVEANPDLKLFRQDFCFAVPKGNNETLAMLNEGLALVMSNGTLTKLQQKWLIPESDRLHSLISAILLSILATLLIGGVIAFLWFNTLRKMVKTRTLQLKKSHEQLQQIINAGDVGLWDWDLITNSVSYSTEWKRQIGYEDHEIGNEFNEWQSRVYIDDIDGAMTTINEAINKLLPGYKMEFRLRHKDDSYRWILVHASLLFDDKGKPTKIRGVHIDISERKQMERQLQESEKLFKTMSENAPLAIYTSSGIEQKAIYINPTFVKLFGYTMEEVPSVTEWWSKAYPDAEYRNRIVEEWQRRVQHAIETSSSIEPMQSVVTCKDGSKKNISWGYTSIGDKNWAFGLDYTESEQAKTELKLAASVFSNTSNGVLITDKDSKIIDCNPAFMKMSGYALYEIKGFTPKLFSSGIQSDDYYEKMWESLYDHDSWHGEFWNRHKNGEVYVVLLTMSIVRDKHGEIQNYLGVFSDISYIKERESELDRIANYDPLTQIPNRRLFYDRLNQEIAHSRRSGKLLALCYLDLDGFKSVNDQYGHVSGDTVLIQITERLKHVVRTEDTLARLGGDEFVLLFTNLSKSDEYKLYIDRVLETINTPIQLESVQVQVSASIGITFYPTDDVDAESLLHHADTAMYLAKESGKNCYHVFNNISV